MIHLRSIHSAKEDTIDVGVLEQMIGRDCQRMFWCGFCGKIVVLQKNSWEGTEERFDHIGKHFHLGEENEDWIKMSCSLVKGEDLNMGLSKYSADQEQ